MATFHQYCLNPEEGSWDPERQKPLDRQGKRLSESVCSATLDREALRLADNAWIFDNNCYSSISFLSSASGTYCAAAAVHLPTRLDLL